MQSLGIQGILWEISAPVASIISNMKWLLQGSSSTSWIKVGYGQFLYAYPVSFISNICCGPQTRSSSNIIIIIKHMMPSCNCFHSPSEWSGWHNHPRGNNLVGIIKMRKYWPVSISDAKLSSFEPVGRWSYLLLGPFSGEPAVVGNSTGRCAEQKTCGNHIFLVLLYGRDLKRR